MSSINSSEPSLKKVKVENEPDEPLGCQFCFETCRGRGRGVDALERERACLLSLLACNYCLPAATAQTPLPQLTSSSLNHLQLVITT